MTPAAAIVAAILPALTTAFIGRTMVGTARVLLATYLGQDAAERVLAGNVIRGRAEPLRAVIWFADLVGFTRIADTTAGDVALNRRRGASGLPVSDAHIALHGEVLYGNVGSPRRLDFTVLGAAVNEAARIEAMCGSLDRAVIVSAAFADAVGAARSRLVSLGRYAPKGVGRPQELYTLESG